MEKLTRSTSSGPKPVVRSGLALSEVEVLKKHIVIIAGEASGDLRAAELVSEIKKADPRFTFSGLGGEKMAKAGVEIYVDLTRMAVVGFAEVLKHFKEIKKIFQDILEKIDEIKPCAVILVDYPGFNLRLAKELKRRGVKVIYYISPQVWAWDEKRIELIKNVVDKMIVFFDFEKTLYKKHQFTVDCVGHPLVDRVKTTIAPEAFLKTLEFSLDKKTIGLLPGSRQKEIEAIFPVMLKTAKYLHEKNPGFQFLVFQAPTIHPDFLNQYLEDCALPLKIMTDKIYDGIHACDFCLVASGAATLETAILQKPMVVIYKTSLLTWALAKILIKIPYIGLVNVVAGKKIVPECIQFTATARNIGAQAIGILSDPQRLVQIKRDLAQVKENLGSPGASLRAAEKIVRYLS